MCKLKLSNFLKVQILYCYDAAEIKNASSVVRVAAGAGVGVVLVRALVPAGIGCSYLGNQVSLQFLHPGELSLNAHQEQSPMRLPVSARARLGDRLRS